MGPYLFVGGSHDGEWIPVRAINPEAAMPEPVSEWNFPTLQQVAASPIERRPAGMTVGKETYIRQRWAAEGADVWLYAIHSMRPIAVLGRLAKFYRPPVFAGAPA